MDRFMTSARMEKLEIIIVLGGMLSISNSAASLLATWRFVLFYYS